MADKIRITLVLEYEPDPECYAGCSDIHSMAELDEAENNIRRYPDAYDDADLISVTYEGISE